MQNAAERATELYEETRHKAAEVVEEVTHTVGREWGGKRMEEAHVEMPGEGEIEYLHVK